jgi:hypothetical protein
VSHQDRRDPLPKGYQFGDARAVRGVDLAHGRDRTIWQSSWWTSRREGVRTFRLGVDTCSTCGTKGKYDCPDCGIWDRQALNRMTEMEDERARDLMEANGITREGSTDL